MSHNQTKFAPMRMPWERRPLSPREKTSVMADPHEKAGPTGAPAQERRLLARGARALGQRLDDAQIDALIAYLDGLIRWSAVYNLTSIRGRRQALCAHLLDSLSAIPGLQGQAVLDLGTGPGFPGLVLAIAQPWRHYTLLDSNGKKLRFVRHMVINLKLANVTVVQARAENWRPDSRFETVVCRALADLGQAAAYARALLAPGGVLLAMKGPNVERELTQDLPGFEAPVVHWLSVPNLAGRRCLVLLRRAAER